jgi:hypothetical protein
MWDALYVHREARTHQQSIVLSSSFRCCSFSLPEVSQTCSQLIHTPFGASLASGLETRNQLRKRQEKNEFNFQLQPKKFLDGKKKRACRLENRNSVWKNFRARQTATIPNLHDHQTAVPIPCASRVDQIGLCTQFPASVSGGQTLNKL